MKKVLTAIKSTLLAEVTLSLALALVLILLSAFLAISIARKNPEPFGLLKGRSIIEKEEEEFISKVGESIELPKDEIPTIATVTDLEKLKEQAFFSKAELGDKVLIYTNARKVILYRSSENRVVEVGTVNINEDVEGLSTEDEEEKEEETIKFAILNGTSVGGLASTTASELQGVLPEVEIVTKADASNKDHEVSLLVNLTGDNQSLASKVAEELNLTPSSLPEDETEPDGVDFVIILGSDKASSEPEPTEEPAE